MYDVKTSSCIGSAECAIASLSGFKLNDGLELLNLNDGLEQEHIPINAKLE
jgi:hypothetical protein